MSGTWTMDSLDQFLKPLSSVFIPSARNVLISFFYARVHPNLAHPDEIAVLSWCCRISETIATNKELRTKRYPATLTSNTIHPATLRKTPERRTFVFFP